MAEDSELESYWTEIRDLPRILVITGRVSNLRETLEVSALHTLAGLAGKLREHVTSALPFERLQLIANLVVDEVLKTWTSDLRHQDPLALFDIVLEGQNLSPEELKGFLRAVPFSVFEKVLQQGVLSKKGTGIHALLAIEVHYRQHQGRDYELRRDADGKVLITAFPAALNGRSVSFRLDEKFNLGVTPGVNTDESTG